MGYTIFYSLEIKCKTPFKSKLGGFKLGHRLILKSSDPCYN